MQLYPINEEYKAVLKEAEAQAELNEGVVDDYLFDILDDLGEKRETALFGMMYETKNLESDLVALKAMKKQVMEELGSKIAKVESAINSRKELLATVLGKTAMSDGVIKTTKAVSVSLKITGDVPSYYRMTTEKVVVKEVVNNAMIKAEMLEGAELDFAELIQRKSVK